MGHLNGYPRKCNFLIINKLQIRLKLGCQSQDIVGSAANKFNNPVQFKLGITSWDKVKNKWF